MPAAMVQRVLESVPQPQPEQAQRGRFSQLGVRVVLRVKEVQHPDRGGDLEEGAASALEITSPALPDFDLMAQSAMADEDLTERLPSQVDEDDVDLDGSLHSA